MVVGGDAGAAGTDVFRRVMRGRDPDEVHRVSTPLELLFDLCFVVAVSQAASELHHALVEGDVGPALVGYAAVFFAIWWAWMNFSWFASAYDTDDVPYRLLTLLQMGGVLVLAAGVGAAFERYDFTIIVIGYVIMRMAMVTQWLRAAREHPEGRPAALRYATGITLVQAGWIARLWAPGVWGYLTFAVLAAAELAVPIWSEYQGRATSWHPGHIAERYGLFTIIVLGEVILAILTAVRAALTEHGVLAPVLLITAGGMVLVFSLWWIYFSGAEAQLPSLRIALAWGYGHYLVFAAVAAVGASLDAAITVAGHQAHASARLAALAIAVPVVLYLLALAVLHRLAGARTVAHHVPTLAGAAAVLALAFATPVIGLGGAALGMGMAVAATLAVKLAIGRRRPGPVRGA